VGYSNLFRNIESELKREVEVYKGELLKARIAEEELEEEKGERAKGGDEEARSGCNSPHKSKDSGEVFASTNGFLQIR
jgi:hypothetical protein